MPDNTNGKVSTKQLYDELIPVIENIAKIQTSMGNIEKTQEEIKNNVATICKDNNDEHKIFRDTLSNIKIKVWGGSAVLSVFSGFIGVMIGKYL